MSTTSTTAVIMQEAGHSLLVGVKLELITTQRNVFIFLLKQRYTHVLFNSETNRSSYQSNS